MMIIKISKKHLRLYCTPNLMSFIFILEMKFLFSHESIHKTFKKSELGNLLLCKVLSALVTLIAFKKLNRFYILLLSLVRVVTYFIQLLKKL